MTPFSIHPDTTVGPVYLTVSDLIRSERFYCDVLGFKPLGRQDDALVLTADGVSPLLALEGRPDARPKPSRTTGLYHFAILVPSRVELARSLRQLAEMGWPLGGASDHLVSEALYLDDPDRNGIEIYHDRPRSEWPRRNDQIQMAVDPLDFDGLLAELSRDDRPWDGLQPATRIGHVHLHVADLRAAEAFYHGVLGFDLMQRLAGSALFISAGGYHHHIGLNTWAGAGAPPPPPDAVGLRFFAVQLPNQAELARVTDRVRVAGLAIEQTDYGLLLRDPSQNGVLLIAGRPG
jgi:catechol 2,3-dioxygenase